MKTLFKPHPGVQTEVLQVDDDVKFLAMCGGRGSGKTMVGIAWLLRASATPGMTGLVVRRNHKDLADWIETAKKMMPHASVTGKPAVFTFPNKSKIYTGHLSEKDSYTMYQGWNISHLLVEELTQIPDLESFLKLCSSVRTTQEGLKSQVFTTFNPGGVGHNWVKNFFKIGDKESGIAWKDDISNQYRCYFIANIADNPTLMESDPDYYHYLDSLPEPLRSAWLFGDFDAIMGNYFKEWNPDVHIIEEDEAKRLGYGNQYNHNYLGLDWGFNAPAVCEFIQVTSNGTCFVFDEVWAKETHPVEFGRMVYERLNGIEIHTSYLDPASWIRNPMSWKNEATQAYSDNSIASAMIGNTETPFIPNLVPANNARIPGWRAIAQKLHYKKDVKPQLYIIKGRAKKLAETIPEMMCDERNPEDLQKMSRDHWCDALRYGLTNVISPEVETEVLTEEQKMIRKYLTPEPKGGWTYNWKE